MNYTVNVSLPKTLADMAKQKVRDGYYSSLSEVIRNALRRYLEDDITVYKMSKKAEKLTRKAYKEYKTGKLIPIKSLKELE